MQIATYPMKIDLSCPWGVSTAPVRFSIENGGHQKLYPFYIFNVILKKRISIQSHLQWVFNYPANN